MSVFATLLNCRIAFAKDQGDHQDSLNNIESICDDYHLLKNTDVLCFSANVPRFQLSGEFINNKYIINAVKKL